jgi:tryptophan-rich sensory protein
MMMKKHKHAILSFAFFLGVCFLVAIFGSLITGVEDISWFNHLQKPAFQPPDWVFGAVWIVLYICIAVSGWLVYIREKSSIRKFALQVYTIQLVLNVLWTGLFYGLHSPLYALIDSVILLCTIFYYIFITRKLSRNSAILFLPYAIWALFATLLNLSIWMLNPV